MGKVAWQLSLELRKVSGDHGDVEPAKDRLLGLAIEQETECGVKPALWRISPRHHSFVCLFAHRYMMTALPTCFPDHHFDFERIAVADLVDLDHSGLRLSRRKRANVLPFLTIVAQFSISPSDIRDC